MQAEESGPDGELKELPSWLNDAFLSEVLQGGEDRSPRVTVLSWSASAAVAAGNNYTSNLYRVAVRYSTAGTEGESTETLIIKAILDQGMMKEIPGDFFETEPRVYKELLPLVHQRIDHRLAPRSFYCPLKNGLVLKDMKAEGYVMCDRFKQLDFQHCKKVFETLAKFHAASVAIHREDPALIESIGAEKLTEGHIVQTVKPFMEFSVRQFFEAIKDEDVPEPLSGYLASKSENLWETFKSVVKRKPDSLNVLNHTDCWIANMLFKYDESGEVADAVLIDFQLSRFTTPVIDLLHVIWTSGNEEVRETKQQELFTSYLTELNTTLARLGCDERLSSDELHRLLQSCTDYIFLLISYVVPFLLNDIENTLNLESYDVESIKNADSNEQFSKIHRGRHYRSQLPSLLRQFNNWLLHI